MARQKKKATAGNDYENQAKKAKYEFKTIVQLFELDQPGMSLHFQSGQGRKRIDEIKERHKVSVIQIPKSPRATFRAVNSPNNAYRSQPTASASYYTNNNFIKFANGLTMTLVIGSLTDEQVFSCPLFTSNPCC